MKEKLLALENINNINGVATLQGLEGIFANLLSVALALGGILLFIVLILGGFQYMTAGGNPQTLEAAKKTLTYAIAGIVLLALSFLVLVFLQEFTGAPITNFQIQIGP